MINENNKNTALPIIIKHLEDDGISKEDIALVIRKLLDCDNLGLALCTDIEDMGDKKDFNLMVLKNAALSIAGAIKEERGKSK